MRGLYNKATVYSVKAKCETPFRTGPAGDILKDINGKPFIQGSSIAGSMRSWFENVISDDKLAKELFESGRVIISEGIFDQAGISEMIASRPRLRIDGATGSAANGAKFDVDGVTAGNSFSFRITVLHENGDELDNAVEEMLSAMNSGFITLGGQKTNGYGRVLLTVNKKCFTMADEKDRSDWLEDRFEGSPLELKPGKSGDVLISVKGRFDNVLVKSGKDEYRDKKRVAVNISENGKKIIPGSSVKGAVRSRVKMIAESLQPGEGSKVENELFGCAASGGTGVPGLVVFNDAVLESPKPCVATRIRINKFTGGVMNQALFTEESNAAAAELKISAPDSKRVCAYLLLALRDLGAGLYGLGSGAGIGRGYIKNAEISMNFPCGSKLLMKFDSCGNCEITDDDKLAEQLLKELEVKNNG